jgi:hypothetical protein
VKRSGADSFGSVFDCYKLHANEWPPWVRANTNVKLDPDESPLRSGRHDIEPATMCLAEAAEACDSQRNILRDPELCPLLEVFGIMVGVMNRDVLWDVSHHLFVTGNAPDQK